MQSFIEEELCAIEVMVQRYRNLDPQALMTAQEAIQKFVLKYLIKADRYWVSDPNRTRPGQILGGPNSSMLPVLLGESVRKRAKGRSLSDCERIYCQVGDLLTEMKISDPEYRTVPEYAKLISEYNIRHPEARISSLHLPEHHDRVAVIKQN
jgi:hypothetical protein